LEQFGIWHAIRAVLVQGWLLARAAGGCLLRLLSIPLRVFRGVGPNVFASLIGVFVGSAITFAWDILKTSRDRQAELIRAARSVDQETQNNLAVISNDLFTLTNDDVEADKRAELVTPPVMPLLTAAGEMVYLHGSFEVYSPELAIGISNVYTVNYIINKRIEDRDFHRFTNQAMDNYSARRKMLNTELEGILKEHEGRLKHLHTELIKVINKPGS
jgi:hypothetical protein